MNEPRTYASLISLAEHLATMLDDRKYMDRLEDETDTLQLNLEELQNAHITAANDGGTEWKPRGKPRSEWTEEDIAYITLENRLEAVDAIRESLAYEVGIAWGLGGHTLSLAPIRLKKLLLAALECWQDIPCPYELDGAEKLKMKGSRCLGPIHLPPTIQALQIQELRLGEVIDDEELDAELRQVMNNQYHAVWQLKTFLISELFPTQEDLICTSDTRTYHIGKNWDLWIVFD